MIVDLDPDGLEAYRSDLQEPEDFDQFWAETLGETSRLPLEVAVRPREIGLRAVELQEVSFAGFGGDRIHGWLTTPRRQVAETGTLPGVVQFQGYTGGRGHPYENLAWAASGFAHLVIDTRGQGAGFQYGSSRDTGPSGPATGGFLTRGIEDPHDYYYRRVFVDAVRSVQALREVADVARIGVVGGSQGGGIALAAAALSEDVSALAAFVPFLCDFRRALRVTDAPPYVELRKYLATHRRAAAAVFRTLGYFDGVAMARRISAPALISAALMDTTCPPSTVFGVYHELRGPKRIEVWEYNGHEGGGQEDVQNAVEHLRGSLSPAGATYSFSESFT